MANKEKIKGSEALLRSLIAEGTELIFGYPGGQIIPVFDTLYDYRDKLCHILTRHEQGAVHAAQGYARVTGKTGVCMVTSGPGATNLVTGIADAMLDSTPLVCITGQVPVNLLGTDAFQEADIISITMPISKWNYQVTSASEIPGAIAKAFYIARSGRPGPVVVDIAKNAQVEMMEYAHKPCLSIRSYNPHPELDTALTAQAVEMINASERPLVLIGQGVKLSGAENEMIAFAETGNLPMATTLMGISAIPSNHPLFMGNLGMHGNLAPNQMSQNADLIIAVGTKFSDRITGNVKSYAPQARIIHVDIDAAELGKNLRVDLPIQADAGEALRALQTGLKHRERRAWFDFAKAKWAEEEDRVIAPCIHASEEFLTMPGVVQRLAKAVQGDAVIVSDVGQNQMFAALYSKFNKTRSFITSGGLGTMGFGLPASMGAKLGLPDRQVIAILGDGGFQMTMQELGTIMQNGIGVKIIILNNLRLGMVRQWQQLFWAKRYSFTTLENPDFSLIAKAYNIPSEKVVEPKQLDAALDKMLKTEGAYLLEVAVMPEENVFPMVPAGASLSDLIFNAIDD